MSLAAVTPLPADVLSGCYCDQQLRFLGGGRQVPPRFKLRRVGPRPFTVGVVNSFGGGFVWILWLAHQVRSVVAATSLADLLPSDHDSPNAPATACSVYVIAHPAAQQCGLHLGSGLGCGRYLQMI